MSLESDEANVREALNGADIYERLAELVPPPGLTIRTHRRRKQLRAVRTIEGKAEKLLIDSSAVHDFDDADRQ